MSLPLARRGDPTTSHTAAARLRPGTQRRRLLAAYAEADFGLTADEAGAAAGLLHTGYWKRCSDLLHLGLIHPVYGVDATVATRPGRSGQPQEVRAITDLGRRVLGEVTP